MKKFEDLTRLGRIRRCKKIIEEGLKHYDLEVQSLTFLEEATNVFYKLVDKKGHKYAVKVYQELSSNLDDALIEMHFLSMVGENTDIVVPKAYGNTFGDYVTVVNTRYDEIPKRVAVYEWMDGVDIDEKEEVEHFVEIGKIMAKLHAYAKNHKIPKDFKPKKIDKVLYYAGDDYFYKMDKYKDKVSKKVKKQLDFMIPYLDERMSKLYESDTFLIHGDFNPFNIKLHKGSIRLLDFEDTSLGNEVHDIAIFLFYYRYDEKYLEYKDAFLEGYRSIRPVTIDEADVEMLMVARRINFMNYILAIQDDVEDYLNRNYKRVEDYLNEIGVSY